MNFKKIALIALAIACSTATYAQKDRQHKGLFLSLSLGPVFGPINVNSNDAGVGEYEMTGTGAAFDFKIGGAVKENLILHATLYANSLVGPKVTLKSGESAKFSDNLTVTESLLGAGVTYYFMPLNVFVSGSAGISNFTIDNRDINYKASTDRGFGLQLKAGKEWWVSRRWGLGVAATYGMSSVNNKPDNNLTEKLTSNRFGISFNATFN